MSVDGIFRNGVIVPDGPLILPEGTRVRIEVASESESTSSASRQGGWWKGRVSIAPDFDELPPDIARAFGMDDA